MRGDEEPTALPEERDRDTAGTRLSLKQHLRKVLYGAGVVVSILVVASLFRTLQRDGPAALAAWRSANVRGAWIVVACVCGMVGHALNVVGWHRLLRDAAVPMSVGDTTRLYFISNLGRYLPGGKAWQLGIVGALAKERGFSPAVASATSLFQGIVGLAIGCALLLISAGAMIRVNPVWLIIALSSLAGLLILPAALHRFPNTRNALVQRIPALESISVGTMWVLIWTATVCWVLWGFGLYALGTALLPTPGASLFAYITAWIGPFLFGLLAVVSPAGLGARDELMKNVLSTAGLSVGDAVMVMVVARMWVTALDILPAIPVVALRGSRQKSTE